MRKSLGLFFFLFLGGTLLVSLCTGRYAMGPGEVCRVVLSALGGEGSVTPPAREAKLIFWNIRFPRILLSFAVGSGISVAGVVFQALFRNPLASPDILGVTAGSCFGAALAILYFTERALGIQGVAFVFGILAVFMAYLLASRSWDRSASVLVISGIVVSAVFQAGLSVLMYVSDPYDQLAKIIFWTMGSFHVSSWGKVRTTLPIVVTGAILISVFAWRLNVMTQQDEDALSLGVDIFRWRLFYVVISTLMVASSVAAVGSIAWIGLIMPHIARYLVGTEHKKLVPAAALLGGTFLLLMDTVARSLMASEIPISVVTSIFGAPFLGYLVLNRGGSGIGSHAAN